MKYLVDLRVGPVMQSNFEERVKRNYERMRRPSYGWWILALIPTAYAVMVVLPVLFGDTSFANALKLSPGDRQFMAVVVIGTLLELGVHQYLSRRAVHGEPDSASVTDTAPTAAPADADEPASSTRPHAASR